MKSSAKKPSREKARGLDRKTRLFRSENEAALFPPFHGALIENRNGPIRSLGKNSSRNSMGEKSKPDPLKTPLAMKSLGSIIAPRRRTHSQIKGQGFRPHHTEPGKSKRWRIGPFFSMLGGESFLEEKKTAIHAFEIKKMSNPSSLSRIYWEQATFLRIVA